MTSRTEAKNEVINRPEENQLKEVTQWLDGHDHDEYDWNDQSLADIDMAGITQPIGGRQRLHRHSIAQPNAKQVLAWLHRVDDGAFSQDRRCQSQAQHEHETECQYSTHSPLHFTTAIDTARRRSNEVSVFYA